VEEEQRADLRSHAHLVRTEAHLGGLLRRYGLVGRWWRYRQVAELRGRLVQCRRRRERSERRLAFMDAKLQVIQGAEQARAVWLTQARQVLVRGLAAAKILTEREQQRDDDQRKIGGPSGPAALEARVRLGVVS
jgi:hypothetical protein